MGLRQNVGETWMESQDEIQTTPEALSMEMCATMAIHRMLSGPVVSQADAPDGLCYDV